MRWDHAAAALLFAATFLMLAWGRVGGRHIPRGQTAAAGGILTALVLRLSPWAALDLDVLALLAGLMALTGLAEAAGLFSGLHRALNAVPARLALFFAAALMAIASALFLNDAAVVVLVPLLLPPLVSVGVRPVPAVVLLAAAANVGSILTPFGNPQNTILAHAAHLQVAQFLEVQGPLVILGLAGMAAVSWWQPLSPKPASPPLSPPRPWGRPLAAIAIAAFVVAASMTGAVGVAALAVAAVLYAALLPVLGRQANRGVRRGLNVNVLLLFV
ncbi:MAG: SLC13 family permease, partial [Thermoplasmatota archaeon]